MRTVSVAVATSKLASKRIGKTLTFTLIKDLSWKSGAGAFTDLERSARRLLSAIVTARTGLVVTAVTPCLDCPFSPKMRRRACTLWPADLDRLFVIRDSTVNFTRGLEGVAATIVSGGILRVDLDRPGIIHDRLVDFPLRAVSEAPTVEGLRYFEV